MESECVTKVSKGESGIPCKSSPAGWWPARIGIGAVADAHLNFTLKLTGRKLTAVGRGRWKE